MHPTFFMTFCSNGLTPDKLGELSAKTAGEDDEDNPAAAESGLLWTYQRTAEVSRYVTKLVTNGYQPSPARIYKM